MSSMASDGAEPGPLLRVFGLVMDSIVDGPGLRLAVFTQGCPHHCLGCHNPNSHDPAGGYTIAVQEIAEMAKGNPLLAGVTLTGGEPMEQAAACLSLVRALPEGLSVWLYSGYTVEEILRSEDPARPKLLAACAVLVDGRYEQDRRSLSARFRGSTNQRLIDIPKTLKAGKAVLWEMPVW